MSAPEVGSGRQKIRRLPKGVRLVLASASPRRAELLRRAGFEFSVLPSPLPEPSRRMKGIPVEIWPTALAFVKGYAVHRQVRDAKTLVLAADTIVVLEKRIMNKPRHRAHARQMLQRLSGRTHQVITGLALFLADRHRFSVAIAECKVGRLSRRWLEAYLDSGLWRNKAGGYGLQDSGDPWITLVSGEWSTVVGLPMELLAREMQRLLKTDGEVPK